MQYPPPKNKVKLRFTTATKLAAIGAVIVITKAAVLCARPLAPLEYAHRRAAHHDWARWLARIY